MHSPEPLGRSITESFVGEQLGLRDERQSRIDSGVALKETYSPVSSFYNAGDINIEEGDIEYLTSHELIDADVQAAVLLSDTQDEPLISENQKASSHGEQTRDDSTKKPATAETLNAADGTKRSLEVHVADQDSVQPEDNRVPHFSPEPLPPSRIQTWLNSLDENYFEDPDLAGPFPPESCTLPAFIASLPSFSPHRDPFSYTNTAPPLLAATGASEQCSDFIARPQLSSPGASPMNGRKKVLRQKKSRSLDGGRRRSPSPIHGSFIPVSPDRTRSLSPRKRLERQSVHINMNLTEYQMDRITDAFSSQLGSPARGGTNNTDEFASRMAQPGTAPSDKVAGNVPRTPIQSQERSLNDLSNPAEAVENANISPRRKPKSLRAPPFNSMPGYSAEMAAYHAATLAQRRKQEAPDHLDINDPRKYGTFMHRSGKFPVSSHPLQYDSNEVSPLDEDDVSSLYSQHVSERSNASPYVRGGTVSQRIDNVMHTYNDWGASEDYARVSGSPVRSMSPRRIRSPVREPSPSRRPEVMARTSALKHSELSNTGYSPLMTYFAFEGLPVQKLGRKTMIGDQGWLDRPTGQARRAPDHDKKDLSPKKLGLLDSIKKMAKDMTESKTTRRAREPDKAPKVSHMTISLDPREQSLLFCELEFQVSNALHTYITNELHHGRLDPNKLKKVADGWSQKGRPRVVGFRYDLETQLNLVNLHIEDFRFFGRRQSNPVEISGLLYAMKVNARAMRVRTFCQPDSVIAKQLVDSQSLFNTIGCSENQQVSLAEIAQFFKVIVERERHYRARLNGTEDIAKDVSEVKDAHPGQPWEPHRSEDAVPDGAFDVYGSITKKDGNREQSNGHTLRYSD